MHQAEIVVPSSARRGPGRGRAKARSSLPGRPRPGRPRPELCPAFARERQTIIGLRNEQVIDDEALRRIQRDLDLAEARLTGF